MREQPPQDAPVQMQDVSVSGLWDSLQRIQSDLTFLQDLSFFYTSIEWLAAETVIDLGTGNGYYLSRVAAHFPEKRYLGLDKSSELIAIAKTDVSQDGIDFSCCDLFDASGTYEYATMRLLLQHLPDLDGLLSKVATIIRPGGAALVIDSCDSLRYFHPPMPEFTRFFTTYAQAQKGMGLDRDAAARIVDRVKDHPQWELGPHNRLIVPSTLPGNKELFKRAYGLVIDVIERTSDIPFDYDALRVELLRWCRQTHAYSQIGVEFVQINRKRT